MPLAESSASHRNALLSRCSCSRRPPARYPGPSRGSRRSRCSRPEAAWPCSARRTIRASRSTNSARPAIPIAIRQTIPARNLPRSPLPGIRSPVTMTTAAVGTRSRTIPASTRLRPTVDGPCRARPSWPCSTNPVRWERTSSSASTTHGDSTTTGKASPASRTRSTAATRSSTAAGCRPRSRRGCRRERRGRMPISAIRSWWSTTRARPSITRPSTCFRPASSVSRSTAAGSGLRLRARPRA